MAKLVIAYIYMMPYLLLALIQGSNLSHLIIRMPFGVQKGNQTQVKGEGLAKPIPTLGLPLPSSVWPLGTLVARR